MESDTSNHCTSTQSIARSSANVDTPTEAQRENRLIDLRMPTVYMSSGLRKESRYHAHMKNDWLKRLEKLKDEAVQHGAIASKLSELRSEARRIFDERIEELTRVRDKERIKEIERVSIQKRPDGTVLVKVPVDWRYVLAAPFIYGMIFPSVIWHLALESYHLVDKRYITVELDLVLILNLIAE